MKAPLLSTRRKIALAKVVHRFVKLGRRAAGRPMSGLFRRNGLNWILDLDEGIDFAIFLFGKFEPEVVRCCEQHIETGSIVLDIGANIGAHTLPLARQVGSAGKVIAIEPTEYTYTKLKRNLGANPELEGRVTALHALLMASATDRRPDSLHSSWPLTGSDTVHAELGGVLKSLGKAASLTLDQVVSDLNLSKVDWIKLDVDGNELSVLSGGANLLGSYRPRILMELAPYCHKDVPGQFEQLVLLLQTHGYRFFHPETLAPYPLQLSELEARIPVNGSINVLAQASGE